MYFKSAARNGKERDYKGNRPLFIIKASKYLNKAMDEETTDDNNPEDEEIRRLMEDYDIDADTAERVQELIDEGIDEDDAVELVDEI